MEGDPGLPYNTDGSYFMTVEEANEAWRKLHRLQEAKVQDQINRINLFEDARIRTKLVKEAKEKKAQIKKLRAELRSLEGVEVRKKRKSKKVKIISSQPI